MSEPYKIIQGKSAFERSIVSSMKMNEATWLRHANPWSVWTRFTCLPLIVLALWSRQWIDMWFIAPLALALIWTWLNPRIFPEPTSFDHWPAKATFGERVWLNRAHVTIARHHQALESGLRCRRASRSTTQASRLGSGTHCDTRRSCGAHAPSTPRT